VNNYCETPLAALRLGGAQIAKTRKDEIHGKQFFINQILEVMAAVILNAQAINYIELMFYFVKILKQNDK